MGKNTKKANEPVKRGNKSKHHLSDKTLKRDGKPKKAKEVDHLKHIPFKLREIIKSKNQMGSKKSQKPREAISSKGKPQESEDGDIPVPHFKRGKQESEKAYLRRMDNAAKHVLFLTKNQIDRKPELDVEQQERPVGLGKSVKKKEHDKGRLQRLHQKKLNRKEDMMEKEMFVDHVPFGEVSMAPPSLNIKPRKAQVTSKSSTKGLLLNSLLGNAVVSTAKPSMARQRIMEEERERAVAAYRHLKKLKQQQHVDMKAARKKTASDESHQLI